MVELETLRKLTQRIVDSPMDIECNTIIKATLNALPYPIFIVDSSYNIKFANNYLSLYFNIDTDKIINKKYTDIIVKNNNFNYGSNLISNKSLVGKRQNFYIPEMKEFPIFNKDGKTVGYICVVSAKQNLNYDFELKQSILYANSILATTTFNSESIAIKCDWRNSLKITDVFSSSSKSHFLSWLKGKSYIDDITYVSDRQKIESYVETIEKDKNKNMMWNSRIYSKEHNILPVQQYMSLRNDYLLVHVASNDDGNIELELS